jgi:hypothetical protein
MPRGYASIQLRALQMLFDIVMVFHFDGLERDGGPRDGASLSVFRVMSLIVYGSD